MISNFTHRQHLLLSLSTIVCLFMAVGLSSAKSNQSDTSRQQRKAQGQDRGQGQGQAQNRKGSFRELLQELDLTEDQKPQIKEVIEKHREQFETFRENSGDALKELHRNMRTAMENKDYPMMHKLIDQLEILEKDRPTKKEMANDIRSILTSEQQAVFDKKIEEMKNKRSQKHMRRRGGPEGSGNADRPQRPRRRNAQNEDDA